MGIFSHEASDDLTVSATFPESNPFGLVVNGEQNGLLLHLQNHGSKNYTLVSAASSFHDPAKNWALVRNSSSLRYNVPLVSGANFSAPYTINSEFRPQELGLTVWVNLAEQGSAELSQITAYNQTVSIVEQPSSWLDPSLIFLYLVLGTALLGGAYAVYKSFFEQKTKKTGGKAKKVKAVVANDKPANYPAVKPYEEEWIPETHLKSRQSKLKKAGGATSGEELTSGGEATSGAESGLEGAKIRKRKGKKA